MSEFVIVRSVTRILLWFNILTRCVAIDVVSDTSKRLQVVNEHHARTISMRRCRLRNVALPFSDPKHKPSFPLLRYTEMRGIRPAYRAVKIQRSQSSQERIESGLFVECRMLSTFSNKNPTGSSSRIARVNYPSMFRGSLSISRFTFLTQ